jgi:hypothetical protein
LRSVGVRSLHAQQTSSAVGVRAAAADMAEFLAPLNASADKLMAARGRPWPPFVIGSSARSGGTAVGGLADCGACSTSRSARRSSSSSARRGSSSDLGRAGEVWTKWCVCGLLISQRPRRLLVEACCGSHDLQAVHTCGKCLQTACCRLLHSLLQRQAGCKPFAAPIPATSLCIP